MRLVLPGVTIQNDRSRCDPTLIKAIARGARGLRSFPPDAPDRCANWPSATASPAAYVRRLVDLAFLSPELSRQSCQAGNRRTHCHASDELDLPLDWAIGLILTMTSL